MLRNFVLLYIISALFACQSEPTSSVVAQPFFDLKSYFQLEQERLKELKQVTKIAFVDGQTEEKIITEIDFNDELELFIASDINKVSWLDKYEVDSIQSSNQLSQINYTAKDKKLKTQFLSIYFQNKEVSKIKILRQSSSFVADMEQELNYEPIKGYSIESRQNVSLSEPNLLRLEVLF